jgi:hypothetical protein
VPNANFPADGLIATTLQKYMPTLEDNVFKSRPFLFALKQAGRIKDADGGTKLVVPLLYAAAPNVGSYADDDVFATAANTGITAAEYDWKQMYGLFHYTGIEKAKNSGRSAVLNLIDARMQQLEMSISTELNQQLFKDGVGNSEKDFTGISAMVSASDPSWGDYGNIDRTTDAWWQATTKAASTANTVVLTDMANVYNSASEGADHPGIIVTTQTGFESYEALLTDNIRYQDTKMGDAGFQSLMYKNAPVVFDDDADADTGVVTEANAPMWFLNMNYITLWKLAGVWFKVSEAKTPVNADVNYQSILLYGQMTSSNNKRQGVLYDVHA